MVQRERLEKLVDFAKKNKLQCGVSDEEIEEVLRNLEFDEQNLQYSNDYEIDMILDKVCTYTKNESLKHFLADVRVENRLDKFGMFAVHTSDDLRRVIADKRFVRKLERVSNIASTIFTIDFYPQADISDVYVQYLISLVHAYDNELDEDYEESYHYAQYLIAEADKKYKGFSDYLIFFGREIYESALSFAVGHEIGHHYLGHIEKLVRLKGNVCDDEVKKDEICADDFGAFFALEYERACISEGNRIEGISEDVYRGEDYRLFGIFVLFQLIEWLGGDVDTPKYPSAKSRLARSVYILKCLGIQDSTVELLYYELRCLNNTIRDTRIIMKGDSI